MTSPPGRSQGEVRPPRGAADHAQRGSVGVISRGFTLVEVLVALAITGIATSIERMATEIRGLQKSEQREVEEFFAKGQEIFSNASQT